MKLSNCINVTNTSAAMLNVVNPTSDSIVCIVGVGAVGLAALMALKLLPSSPKQVIAVDVVLERLELAKKYGATDLSTLEKSKTSSRSCWRSPMGKALMGLLIRQGVLK